MVIKPSKGDSFRIPEQEYPNEYHIVDALIDELPDDMFLVASEQTGDFWVIGRVYVSNNMYWEAIHKAE
jgi:hypothetical protein